MQRNTCSCSCWRWGHHSPPFLTINIKKFSKKKGSQCQRFPPKQTCDEVIQGEMWKGGGITSAKGGYGGEKSREVAGHGGLKGINMGMHAYGKYAQAWGQAMAWTYVVGSTLDINSYALVLQAGTTNVQVNHVHGSMPCLNLLNIDVLPYECIPRELCVNNIWGWKVIHV